LIKESGDTEKILHNRTRNLTDQFQSARISNLRHLRDGSGDHRGNLTTAIGGAAAPHPACQSKPRARGGSVASGGELGLAPRGIDFWPARRLRRIERRRIDRAQIPQEWNRRDVIENAFGRPWRRPGGFEFADSAAASLSKQFVLHALSIRFWRCASQATQGSLVSSLIVI
jgi:hypothetical protein